MAYPSFQQYQEALQHPRYAFTDQLLASGTIAISGLGTPKVLSGGFALTYPVESGGKKYAVRCFHREAKGLERRYQAISKRLKALASPYFLDFQYQPNGVRIAGGVFPLVRMAWATGDTLGEFVAKHHRDAAKLNNLLTSLLKLSAFLEVAGIAHGDVQDLNLIVSDDGRRVQLIDYDGMFVPELASLGGSELGHRDYQHPQRDERKYDATLDRFSFITLNLALRALCAKPDIWQSSQSGAGVIVFRANDYAAPAASVILNEISKIPSLQQDAQRFAAICASSFSSVPTLAQFCAGQNIPLTDVRVHTRPVHPTTAAAYISSYPVLDAADYSAFLRSIGQMVELVGKVVEVKEVGNQYILVNFAHWKGQAVKIIFWSEALATGGERPSRKWVGRWITIRGLVEPVYKSPTYRYEHISITAGALSQVSQLTESEARHRLNMSKAPLISNKAPPSTNNATTSSTATAANNAAALERMRNAASNRAVPTALPPSNASPPPFPNPSAPSPNSATLTSSRNRAVLQQMQATQRPNIPLQPANKPNPPHRVTPTLNTQKLPATPVKPKGFWGWLADLLN